MSEAGADDLDETYSVVLTGNVIHGFERESVIRDFAARQKSSPERAAAFLDGRRRSVKKNCQLQDATRICERLRTIGIECSATLQFDLAIYRANLTEAPRNDGQPRPRRTWLLTPDLGSKLVTMPGSASCYDAAGKTTTHVDLRAPNVNTTNALFLALFTSAVLMVAAALSWQQLPAFLVSFAPVVFFAIPVVVFLCIPKKRLSHRLEAGATLCEVTGRFSPLPWIDRYEVRLPGGPHNVSVVYNRARYSAECLDADGRVVLSANREMDTNLLLKSSLEGFEDVVKLKGFAQTLAALDRRAKRRGSRQGSQNSTAADRAAPSFTIRDESAALLGTVTNGVVVCFATAEDETRLVGALGLILAVFR